MHKDQSTLPFSQPPAFDPSLRALYEALCELIMDVQARVCMEDRSFESDYFPSLHCDLGSQLWI